MRRPVKSLASGARSASGSKANSDKASPPLPLGVPWQPPELQPCLVSAASTPYLNETVSSARAAVMLTGIFTDWPPTLAVKVVVPTASGLR